MAPIIDEIGKKITAVGQGTKNAIADFSQTTKLKDQISFERNRINTGYLEIGQNYYKAHAGDPASQFAEAIRQIQTSLDRIDSLEREIKMIQKVKTCPTCGVSVKYDSAFCPKCGVAFRDYHAQNAAPIGFCTNCGASLTVETAFCTECGMPAPTFVSAAIPLSASAPAPLPTPTLNEPIQLSAPSLAAPPSAVVNEPIPAPDTERDEPASTLTMAKLFCTNCGAGLEPKAVFCTECGAPVVKAEEAEVETEVEVEAETTVVSAAEENETNETAEDFSAENTVPQDETQRKATDGLLYCPNCGAEWEAEAAFCVECGTRVESEATSAPIDQPSSPGENMGLAESINKALGEWRFWFKDVVDGKDIVLWQEIAIGFIPIAVNGFSSENGGFRMGGILREEDTVDLIVPAFFDSEPADAMAGEGNKAKFGGSAKGGLLIFTGNKISVIHEMSNIDMLFIIEPGTVVAAHEVKAAFSKLSMTSAGPAYEVDLGDDRLLFRTALMFNDDDHKAQFEMRLQSLIKIS